MARFTPEDPIARIESPFEDEVMLRRLSGEESVSGAFRFDVGLHSENPDLDPEDIVGRSVSIELKIDPDREREGRWIHGFVSRFAFQATHEEGYSYRAELVPWTWLLTLSSNCRVFQQLNVVEVAREVISSIEAASFETALVPEAHATRDYCVQYRETDLAFLERLFEQEGYFYFFRHDSSGHTLVLTSADLQASDCPELPENVRWAGSDEDTAEPGFLVSKWTREQALHPAAVALADYNYEDPRTRLLVTRESSDAFGAPDPTDAFDYPGEFDKLGPADGAKLDYGEEWVRLRMLEREAAAIEVRGRGACPLFAPGMRFDLVNHGRAAENDTYLLTSVKHTLVQTVGGESDAEDKNAYENEFRCIPTSIRYVPRRRTPAPTVHGPQTAVVVGEEGAEPGEVRIDAQGRVKVLFHWDRDESNPDPTCWIRVAQGWAGPGWGVQYHPRVGQEVVVSFLEGDPDRPLVTGRVYNAVNEIPYPSPTQGGIRTRSTPDGSAETFNELRFEDSKDEEEIYLQAEKDLRIYVKNDESKEIDANRTEKVAENVTVEIGEDHQESVGSNRTVEIGGDLEETVEGEASFRVVKSRRDAVEKDLSVTVDGDSERTIAGKETTEISKDANVSIRKKYELEADEVTIKANKKLTLEVGPAKVSLDTSGKVTCEGSNVELKGSAGVTLKGAKVTQN